MLTAYAPGERGALLFLGFDPSDLAHLVANKPLNVEVAKLGISERAMVILYETDPMLEFDPPVAAPLQEAASLALPHRREPFWGNLFGALAATGLAGVCLIGPMVWDVKNVPGTLAFGVLFAAGAAVLWREQWRPR